MHQAQYAHGVVLRASYYTSTVGNIEELEERIHACQFPTFPVLTGPWPNRLHPEVFKRIKGTQRSKGVDIKLTIDVLTQAWNDNLDTVILLTGDGDYLPLVREVQRAGKLVLLAAFSSGLSAALARTANDFLCLDGVTFISPPAT